MPITTQKEVLTTGDVARLCHVAPRTVSKWFDTGKLRGYRIPGSRDRRIPLAHLLAFMRVHGIPLDGFDGGACRVLIVQETPEADWTRPLSSDGRYELRSAANGFEAGVVAQQFRPHVIVLDVSSRREDEIVGICRIVKSSAEFSAAKIIAAVDAQSAGREWFMSRGFDDCVSKPVSPADLVAAIQRVTNLIA